MGSTLSLCMIVKDEEQFLADCLNNVKEIVDEIILVDTGSSDKTIEIAKSFGAKVFHMKWDDDFSKPRNKSLKEATKDWILLLDPDEVIAKQDLKKIKDLINKNKQEAYSMLTWNYVYKQKPFMKFLPIQQEYQGYNHDMNFYWISAKVRLFPNHKNICFKGVVHEMVELSLEKKNIKIVDFDVPVHHYNQLNKQRSREKRFFYLNISKRKLEREPDNSKAYLELGREYFGCRMHHRAIYTYKKGLKKCISKKDDSVKSMIFSELGLAYKFLKKYSEAEKYLLQALELKSDSRKSLDALSEIRRSKKEGVLILCYHNISNSKNEWSLTLEKFKEQINDLIKQNYKFVTLDYFLSNNINFSRKVVAITFDDGRKSVYTETFSFLKKQNIKATIFITTDWIDGKNIPKVEQYSDFMSWKEIKELHKEGWIVGSHGKSHKDLTFVEEELLRKELTESKNMLEKKIGTNIVHFAYPYGHYDEKVKRTVLESGYETISTIDEGFTGTKLHLKRYIMRKDSRLQIISNKV